MQVFEPRMDRGAPPDRRPCRRTAVRIEASEQTQHDSTIAASIATGSRWSLGTSSIARRVQRPRLASPPRRSSSPRDRATPRRRRGPRPPRDVTRPKNSYCPAIAHAGLFHRRPARIPTRRSVVTGPGPSFPNSLVQRRNASSSGTLRSAGREESGRAQEAIHGSSRSRLSARPPGGRRHDRLREIRAAGLGGHRADRVYLMEEAIRRAWAWPKSDGCVSSGE